MTTVGDDGGFLDQCARILNIALWQFSSGGRYHEELRIERATVLTGNVSKEHQEQMPVVVYEIEIEDITC